MKESLANRGVATDDITEVVRWWKEILKALILELVA